MLLKISWNSNEEKQGGAGWLTRDSDTGNFLRVLQSLSEHLF